MVLSKSLQMITCEVLWPDTQLPVIISFVYASNIKAERCCLWDELVSLSTNHIVVGKAWAVLGDFNQVLNPNEHSGEAGHNVDTRTRDFRSCLLNASLSDLNFRGCSFTWWNKRRSNPIA